MSVSSLTPNLPKVQPTLVPMFSPDGQLGDIPSDRVAEAQKAGFKAGIEMIAPTGEMGVIPGDKYADAVAKGFKPKTAIETAQPRVGEQLEQPQGSLLRGLYSTTVGPLVDLAGSLKEYYQQRTENQSTLQNVIDASGGVVTMLKDAISDPKHPLHQLGEGLVKSALDQAQAVAHTTKDATQAEVAAIRALTRGDLATAKAKGIESAVNAIEAAGHSFATVLPGVGPAAAHAGEEIGKGNVAEGVGESVGLVGSVAVPAAAGELSKIAGKVLEPSKASTVNKIVAATSPKVGAGTFLESAQKALPELESLAKTSAPRNLAGVVKLTEEAGKQLESQFQSVLDSSINQIPVKSLKVKTDAIADAMENKVTDYLAEKYPAEAAKIKEQAAFYRGKEMTLEKLNDYRRSVNSENEVFYKKNNINRADALRDPSTAYRVAEGDAIRDLLYDKIADATGQDMRSLKQLQGSITEIRRAAQENFDRLTLKDAKLKGQSQTQRFMNVVEHTFSSHPVAGIRQLWNVLFPGSRELRIANSAARRAFNPTLQSAIGKMMHGATAGARASQVGAVLSGADQDQE